MRRSTLTAARQRVSVALVIGAVQAAPVLAQETATMQVAVARANLRSAASIDSVIVRVLGRGAVVMVLERRPPWIQVRYESLVGWLRSSQVEPVAHSNMRVDPSSPVAASDLSPPLARTAAQGDRVNHEPAVGPRTITVLLLLGMNQATGTFNESPAGASRGDVLGVVAGAGLSIPFGRTVSAEFDVLYAGKGVRVGSGAGEVVVRASYAELPVIVRLDIGRFGLGAGAAVAYQLACKLEDTASATPCADDGRLSGDVERFDVGAVASARLRFGSIRVEVRYVAGLRAFMTVNGAENRNRSLQVVGAWAF